MTMTGEVIRAYLYKQDSGNYQAQFYCKVRTPKKKYFALGTKDATVARQMLAKWERAITEGEWDPWTDPAPEDGLLLTEAVERFLTAKTGAIRPKSVQSYRWVLEAFADLVPAGTMLRHVTAKHCKSYYARKATLDGEGTISATTRASYARNLRAFFNWCVKAKLIRKSPMDGLTLPKAPSKEPNFLTRPQYSHLIKTIDDYATAMESEEDIAQLLAEAGIDYEPSKHVGGIQDGQVRWMIDLIKVACGTGLRRGELRAMRWNWIDLDQGTLKVQETQDFTPKTGDERLIYPSSVAMDVLRRLYSASGENDQALVFPSYNGGKISGSYLTKRFRFFRDLAKLPDTKNVHALRHTYASWLVQAGVDLYRVQKLCGHKSMQTTYRYAGLAPKNLRDATDQLNAFMREGA